MLTCPPKRCNLPGHAFVIFILIIPPATLALSSFQKDLLLAPFVIAAAVIILKPWPAAIKVCLILLTYTVYAMVFRQYFALISFAFLLIFIFRQGGGLKYALIFFVPVALMVIPTDVFNTLQEPRDVVNITRTLRSGANVSRTMFLNPLPPENALNFLVNYGYAVVRLNIPILFSLNPKDFFLFVNISIYLLCLFWGYKNGDGKVKLSCDLFLSHFLILMLFEPDLGSYARHISCTLPFAAIVVRSYFTRHPCLLGFNINMSENYVSSNGPTLTFGVDV